MASISLLLKWRLGNSGRSCLNINLAPLCSSRIQLNSETVVNDSLPRNMDLKLVWIISFLALIKLCWAQNDPDLEEILQEQDETEDYFDPFSTSTGNESDLALYNGTLRNSEADLLSDQSSSNAVLSIIHSFVNFFKSNSAQESDLENENSTDYYEEFSLETTTMPSLEGKKLRNVPRKKGFLFLRHVLFF